MKYSISFVFDEMKATQAACYLLSLNAERMNYMKLIKLLYLADRKFIADWSNSITTDCYVSMENGPVTSRIYDLIKEGKSDNGSYWASCIRTNGDDVVLTKTIGEYDRLSPMEMEVIAEVSSRFESVGTWDVVNFCQRNLAEWQDPSGSSIPITIEDIIHAVKSDKDVDECIEQMSLAASIQKNNCVTMQALQFASVQMPAS